MQPWIELPPRQFETVRAFADESKGEAEYYHALLDGRQRGRVFCDEPNRPRAVLFWHYAGYGFVAGSPGTDFMRGVLAVLLGESAVFTEDTALQKRFILQQDDPSRERILERAPGLLRSERLCFTFGGHAAAAPALPEGFRLQPIDAVTLPLLRGCVTPAFSWDSDAAFLRGGRGCCILRGTEPVAWAFSSAIGGGRLDVGVETAEPYRGRGLARAAAYAMAEMALQAGLRPVWGCDALNPASARTAESAGFILTHRHAKYKKAPVHTRPSTAVQQPFDPCAHSAQSSE